MLSESKTSIFCSVFVKVHIRDKGILRRRLMMIKTKKSPRCTG